MNSGPDAAKLKLMRSTSNSLTRRWWGLVALTLVLCAAQIAVPNTSLNPSVFAVAPTKRVRLQLGGMDCKNCEAGIKGELDRTPGVIASEVSFERQEAVVDYDPA